MSLNEHFYVRVKVGLIDHIFQVPLLVVQNGL